MAFRNEGLIAFLSAYLPINSEYAYLRKCLYLLLNKGLSLMMIDCNQNPKYRYIFGNNCIQNGQLGMYIIRYTEIKFYTS